MPAEQDLPCHVSTSAAHLVTALGEHFPEHAFSRRVKNVPAARSQRLHYIKAMPAYRRTADYRSSWT